MREAKSNLQRLEGWDRTATPEAIEEARRVAAATAEVADKMFMCMDIAKSYASFSSCKVYPDSDDANEPTNLYQEERFPAKLTDLRPTDTWDHPGFYLIDQLDWSEACPFFARACATLKHPYRNLNVYPRPDLVVLEYFGVQFVVLEGCWSEARLSYVDIAFPGSPKDEVTGAEATGMYRKDDRGAAFYSRWAGACNQLNYFKTFWMKGEREYFENMASYLPEGARVLCYDNGAAKIEYERKSVPHLSHMTAYLNAYERIRMLEQLAAVFTAGNDPGSVVWVDKDDMTCARPPPGKAFQIMPYMHLKNVSDKSYANMPVTCYLSNVWQDDGLAECPYARLTTPQQVRPGRVVAYFGQGGDGKTHDYLVDKGLSAVLYVAPSYDLLQAKMDEYGVKGVVTAVALGGDFEKVQFINKSFSVIVWDEVSEWWIETVEQVVRDFPFHKHILCGDPGYQLPPIKKMQSTRALTPLTKQSLEQFRLLKCDPDAISIYRSSGRSYRCKSVPVSPRDTNATS